MFHEFTLPNGLRVIAQPISHFRSVSVGLWIGAGSMYEVEQNNGLSHFVEHMLFKGTQSRSARQIAQAMDAIGGQMNAFTAKECTCYYAKVMDEYFENAVDLLSDLLLHATLDPVEFEKERGVILEEIAMVEDTPEDLVHDMLSAAHYQGQSLARPILGTAEQIRAVAPQALAAFHAAHYRPDNTVLAVAGNYDLVQLEALAQKYLGAWQSPHPAEKPPLPTGYTAAALRRDKDIEQTHVCLSYPGVPQGSVDIYPLSILNNLFGGGMSSRLFQKIREEMGVAYSVYSYPTQFPGSGMFTIYAGTGPENAARVVAQIAQEVALLLREGVGQAEFAQARDQLKGNYILGLESASSRMSAIGRNKLLMDHAYSEEEVLERIAVVTLQDVERVAGQIFSQPCAAALVGRNATAVDISPMGLV
ncbi:MAG: insulinase family protein [Oscillospiraceae bacterium]|jgi:predicted Zn-dependent peptidase|nr:insulinase family protein [Oscillospiraceae bacterium]